MPLRVQCVDICYFTSLANQTSGTIQRISIETKTPRFPERTLKHIRLHPTHGSYPAIGLFPEANSNRELHRFTILLFLPPTRRYSVTRLHLLRIRACPSHLISASRRTGPHLNDSPPARPKHWSTKNKHHHSDCYTSALDPITCLLNGVLSPESRAFIERGLVSMPEEITVVFHSMLFPLRSEVASAIVTDHEHRPRGHTVELGCGIPIQEYMSSISRQ